MNLQESINRIKKLIGLNEQKTNSINPKDFKLTPATSDYLGKGGGFERSQYSGMGVEQYTKLLNEKAPGEIKKIRLIFPMKNWEIIALKMIKKLGIVTGVFKDLNSAIRFIQKLKNKGVKADEFVIGSHGSGGILLMTHSGEVFDFNNQFLENFKGIIHSGTKVFFTACHGADYLDTLKDAAEKIGVGVYGSEGIYNYVTNESEKGYYWCSPQKFNKPKTKIKPLDLDGADIIKINLQKINKEYQFDDEGPINYIITINKSVFGVPVPLISTKTKKPEIYRDYSVRGNNKILTYEINLNDEIYYAMDANKNIVNFYNKKLSELEKTKSSALYIGTYLKEKFLSNEIVIEVILDGKKVNIKSLPEDYESNYISNEFLLENKLCKKIDSAPISWL